MEPKTLMQITSEVATIENMLLESGGEITPEIEKILAIKDIQLPDKIEGYHIIQEKLLSASEMYKNLSKQYAQAAKFLENAESRLIDRMKYAMSELGVSEIHGNSVRYVIKPTAGSLVIDDPDLIPLEFKEEKTTTEIKKDKLKDALKSGDVSGAHIELGLSIRKYLSKKIGV